MSSERIGRTTYIAVGLVALAVVAASLIVGAHSSDGRTRAGAARSTPTVTTTPTGELTFGAWGTGPEVAAYRRIVADYDATSPTSQVRLQVYASADALTTAVAAGDDAPDIYLLPRTGLAQVMAKGRNRPLQELMSDRGVSLGDDYSRDAITAFSADDDLQCMPYTVSPMVIYYNTDLIDFDAMKVRGLDVPDATRQSFTLAEFRAAALYASRKGTAGLAIDPTLLGLAPFIYSGGGQLFDNSTAPTSLALGNGGAPNALRSTLEVLRDARLTLTTDQLSKQSALQWFEHGQVAMIAGFRSLVPELRKVSGLHFDVLPMPAVGSNKTVGDFTGACLLSGHRHRIPAAADFLGYLVGNRAMSVLAKVGSVQPSNLRVAYAPAFQQPTQQPAHASVFTDTLRNIQTAPLGVPWQALDDLVGPALQELFTTPVLDDLSQRLDAIDLRSEELLAPLAASSSPSATG